MPTFSTFSDLLPDPVNRITDSGNSSVSGKTGPGFSKVSFSSTDSTEVTRTISGRGVGVDRGSHYWGINISYHPMFREDFETIDSFLLSRNGRLNPFYVILPQYSKPRDPVFFNYVNAGAVITVNGIHQAGSSTLNISSTTTISGNPRPGDFINIVDGANINHQKAYKITRVETNTDYQSASVQPTISQKRLHIYPPLERLTSAGSSVVFINPKFRVYKKGSVHVTDLNVDNLFEFGLELEEIQP